MFSSSNPPSPLLPAFARASDPPSLFLFPTTDRLLPPLPHLPLLPWRGGGGTDACPPPPPPLLTPHTHPPTRPLLHFPPQTEATPGERPPRPPPHPPLPPPPPPLKGGRKKERERSALPPPPPSDPPLGGKRKRRGGGAGKVKEELSLSFPILSSFVYAASVGRTGKGKEREERREPSSVESRSCEGEPVRAYIHRAKKKEPFSTRADTVYVRYVQRACTLFAPRS